MNRTTFIARTAILLALTLAFQLLGLPQPITGPLVNTMLYLATLLVGIGGAVFIGALTPVIAFYRGILAPVLGPAIPFIALGNATLSVVFGLLARRSMVAGIISASILKWLVLAASVTFLIKVPPKAAAALGTPQVFTALAGGALAWIVWSVLKKTGMVKD